MSQTKPHILLISDHGAIIGGAEKVAFTSGLELVRRGYSVSALIGSDKVDPELVSAGIAMEAANLPPFWDAFFARDRVGKLKTLGYDSESEAWFKEKLSGFDPANTVVHFHTFANHACTPALKSAADLGFAIVCTCHDFNLVCPTSSFYNNVTHSPCGKRALSLDCWKTQCLWEGLTVFKILRNSRQFGQNVWFKLLNKITRFVFVSYQSGAILSEYLPKTAKTMVIRNPVDIPRRPRVAAEENRTLLWVGRMTLEKNPEIVARVASQLGLNVVFVGDGRLKESMEKEFPDHEYVGWKSPEEVAAAYGNARAIISSSRCYETASLVVLDGLSVGVPAIIPDISAANDWVKDGENGYVFKFDSDESLKTALAKLADPHVTKQVSETAYERFWQDPPTLGVHVDALEAMYREVLAERPKR